MTDYILRVEDTLRTHFPKSEEVKRLFAENLNPQSADWHDYLDILDPPFERLKDEDDDGDDLEYLPPFTGKGKDIARYMDTAIDSYHRRRYLAQHADKSVNFEEVGTLVVSFDPGEEALFTLWRD